MSTRFIVLSCLPVLLGIGSICADSPSSGDEAIKDAIQLLETRLSQIKDKIEADKVTTAITQLKLVREAPNSQKITFSDFIDNTNKYKGKVITLDLTVSSLIVGNKKQSLRDFVGSSVEFYAFGPKHEHLDITVDLPTGLDVPKAVLGDRLSITFLCTTGQLDQGNQAKTVSRPVKKVLHSPNTLCCYRSALI